MKIELAGPEFKAFLADLTKIVERMEKATAKYTPAPSTFGAQVVPFKTFSVDDEAQEAGVLEDDSKTGFDQLSDDADSDEDDDFAPPAKTAKATKKKAVTSFDDAFGDEEGDDEEPAEEEKPAPAKATPPPHREAKAAKSVKAPKFTRDDVNDACKARAARTSVADVQAFLKKHFGVKSISGIPEEKYEMAIVALKGKK